MIGGSGERLVGESRAAYSVGYVRGPVRLEFTDRRLRIVSAVPSSGTRAVAGYKAWRASALPTPVCRIVGAPYTNPAGAVMKQYPNPEVSQVRVRREIGIGVDTTLTDVTVSNARQGWPSFGPPTAEHPGLPTHSSGVGPPSIFRVPAPPGEIVQFVRNTPLAKVLVPP